MKLALAAGEVDVTRIQDRITSSQFSEWIAYFYNEANEWKKPPKPQDLQEKVLMAFGFAEEVKKRREQENGDDR